MQSKVQRIGILAGGGSLPLEVAMAVRRAGHDVHIVALDQEADTDFGDFPVQRVNWGAIQMMIESFKAAGVERLVIVGGVKRPDIMKIRPDRGLFFNLGKIIKLVRAGGDDGVLRHVVRFFEGQGFEVVGPGDVAPELVVGAGPLGRVAATEDDYSDVRTGFDIVRRLGRFDVGQGVIVNRGTIEAIEGAEGTDKMLERVALMRIHQGHAAAAGVLVKRPKPGQEMRVDMPAIGPQTAVLSGRAGLAGIAVLEGAAITAERQKLISAADESGLFVQGFADDERSADLPPFDGEISFVQLGDRKLSQVELNDLRKGIGVLEALAPYEIGSAVAVARRHVLAIEVGEGNEAFLHRVKTLRQWGKGLTRKAIGIGVFGHSKPFGPALINEAEKAGLAGVMIASDGLKKSEWPVAIVNANKLKMFIGALTVSQGTPT